MHALNRTPTHHGPYHAVAVYDPVLTMTPEMNSPQTTIALAGP
jgi:hypothetical protein